MSLPINPSRRTDALIASQRRSATGTAFSGHSFVWNDPIDLGIPQNAVFLACPLPDQGPQKAIMSPLTNREAADAMQSFVDIHRSRVHPQNFDKSFYDALSVRSATVSKSSGGTPAQAIFHCKIPPLYSNQPADSENKTTHGAAITTFFDMTTSLAIVAANSPGWGSTGVSRRLDVTYLKPPVEGEDVLIECEVMSIGKRLASIRGLLKREKDGALLATCQHDKYMADKPHYKEFDKAKM